MLKVFRYFLYALLTTIVLTTSAYAEDYKKGYDYLVLPPSATAKIPAAKDKIVVIEFFSFECPACYRLEPALMQWAKHKPAYVEFYRVPAIFQPSWNMYAQSYYIAQALNVGAKMSPALFKAIQKDQLDLLTPEAMAAFFETQGVKKEKFLSLYNTPSIDLRVNFGQQLMNDAMIFQTPTVLIDGTYRVDPSLTGSNMHRLISIVNYLIEKQAVEKKLINPTAAVAQKGGQPHKLKSV